MSLLTTPDFRDREGISSKWENISIKLRNLGVKKRRRSKGLSNDEQKELFELNDKKNDNKYLRYYTNATLGFVQSDYVYDKLTTYIDSKSKAITFLDEFDKALQFFDFIFSKTNAKSTDLLKRILNGFIKGNFESYAPMALSIHLKNPDNYDMKNLDYDNDLLRVMKEYDRFFVLGVLSGLEKTGIIEKTTSDLAVKYYHGEISIDEVVNEIHGFIRSNKFENIISGLELKEWHEYSAKYVLSELYNRNMKGSPVIASLDNVNIEHILPKKPSKDWNISIEDHTVGCMLIGNQIILRETCNMSIHNTGFQRKKYAYVGLNYDIIKDKNPKIEYDEKTRAVSIIYNNDESTKQSVTENKQYCDIWDNQFMNVDDWNLDTIKSRSKLLANKILETWNNEGDKSPSVDPDQKAVN